MEIRAHFGHFWGPFWAHPWMSGHISDMSMAHFGHIPGCQGPLWACLWPISGTYINIRAHFRHISGMSLAYFRHINGNQGTFWTHPRMSGPISGISSATYVALFGHFLGLLGHILGMSLAHFRHIHGHQGPFQDNYGHVHGQFRAHPWPISGTSMDIRAHIGHIHGPFRTLSGNKINS